jgi:hypothetical protein
MSDNKIVQRLTYADALVSEYNEILLEVARMDIDIAILEKTDPELIVAEKKLTANSVEGIPAKVYIVTKRKEREGKQLRLDNIEVLLKGKPGKAK